MQKAKQHLDDGRRVGAWYWVASGKTALSKTTSEFRRLSQAGIQLVGGTLRLPRAKRQ